MTRLMNPPTPVAVTLNADGTPAYITGSWTGAVDPIARWKVVLNSDLLCELFHDVSRDEWFIERVYD